MQKLTDDLLDDVIEAVEEASNDHKFNPDDLIHAELEFLKELRDIRRKKKRR